MSRAIDKVRWVQRTIEKMQAVGADDKQMWDRFWLETYFELGGKSRATGSKGCPKAAAYGLWYLGRISGSERPRQNWSIEKIREHLGKNAAYAVLAITLLDDKNTRSGQALWQEVQRLYQRKLMEKPADSEQGEIVLTKLLYSANRITASSQYSKV